MESEMKRVIDINLDLTNSSLLGNEPVKTSRIFYTTDIGTSHLRFTSKNEISNSIASIVLKNLTDGSKIQRDIEVTDKTFSYILGEEIKHAGDWIGQVVIEKDNKFSTSRSFKFQITGGLLGVPSLSDVDDYKKLYKQLNSLNDDMATYLETALLSEEQRVEAEKIRNSLFEEFETNEAIRLEAETNRLESEAIRVGAETKRVEAETNRVYSFEEFKANEEIRKNNEINREENYELKIDSAIIESEIDTKVNNKVIELTPAIQQVTAQLAQTAKLPSSLSVIKKVQTLVSFVDDDGNKAVLTKLLPISENKGIPFTVCMPSDFMLNNVGMSIDNLKMLQNDKGFEIASHAKTHEPINNNTMSEEQQYLEVYESWRVMREKGLNIETIVYPYGQVTSYAKSILSRYYKAGVSTDARLNQSPLNTYNLGRYGFPQDGKTLDYYKGLVDTAISKNGWLIFMLHCGQENVTNEQLNILNQLVDYIQLKNIEVVNITDGIDRIGNAIDYNEQEFYMARDGKNNMVNYIPVNSDVLTGKEKLTFDMLYTSFEKNKTYIGSIHSAEQLALSPSKKRGVISYIILETVNSYRTFVDVGGTRYTSYVNADGVNWKSWTRDIQTTGTQSHTVSLTIPGNSLREFSIPKPSYSDRTIANVNPKLLPNGLMFSYYDAGSQGVIKVRIFNTTTAEIVLTNSVWDYFIMDMS